MIEPDAIGVIRRLLQEIRRLKPGQKQMNYPITRHILDQCRKYSLTDAQLCKKKNEMLFLADTYRCYLESSRRYRELLQKYRGEGERSIKQTADLVGFKLPHDPK